MSSAGRTSWTADAVIAEVESHRGSPCDECAAPLLGHDVVIGLMLREQGRRCCDCLARRHARPAREFLVHARALVQRLDCFRAGWAHADRRLAAQGAWPEERFPRSLRLDSTEEDHDGPSSDPGTRAPALELSVAGELDAGDMGCGELVLLLRARMNPLAPGERLRVIARDPGAPEDLPAWCRLTGHRLCAADPPCFVVERRPD